MTLIFKVKDYDVDLNFPFTCTCNDFKARHDNKGTFCKHIIKKLKELGDTNDR